jgi:hypothetical protein
MIQIKENLKEISDQINNVHTGISNITSTTTRLIKKSYDSRNCCCSKWGTWWNSSINNVKIALIFIIR